MVPEKKCIRPFLYEIWYDTVSQIWENSKISVSGPDFSLEGHSKVAVGGRVSYAYVAVLLINSTS
jgi:hypothetical protein